MKNMPPDFKPPVAELFELAHTSFDPPAFRRACERFAMFDSRSSDDDLWFFTLKGGPSLMVSLEVEPIRRGKSSGRPEFRPLAVTHAILAIYWWENFLVEMHESRASWEVERAEFDRVYAESLAATIEALGPPLIHGGGDDEDRLRHALWRGTTGLLILQQSASDPQFGLDVSYRVEPWSGPDPRPTSPFGNWLAGLYVPRQSGA
jgi:hypothetical protein